MEDRRNMTVLLLEDQPLIAMDTEATLKRAGFVHVVHFSSLGPALDWLSTNRPDLVIMEITLQNEPCVTLAEQFARQNVPYLLYTGASRMLIGERIFHDTEWISKPSEIELLDAAIARVLPAA